jgi:hypothetical protein
MADLMTTAEIAAHLGEKARRVRHIINYHEIAPTERASTVKLFDMKKVALIKQLLFDMQIYKK